MRRFRRIIVGFIKIVFRRSTFTAGRFLSRLDRAIVVSELLTIYSLLFAALYLKLTGRFELLSWMLAAMPAVVAMVALMLVLVFNRQFLRPPLTRLDWWVIFPGLFALFGCSAVLIHEGLHLQFQDYTGGSRGDHLWIEPLFLVGLWFCLGLMLEAGAWIRGWRRSRL